MTTGNSSMLNIISSLMSTSNSPGTILDQIQGLQLRSTFSVSWSYEELEVLKQGLVRYANEPNILKYVKIAAMLPDKTVRDVAMRCQWMTVSLCRWMTKENGKRHKPEDFLIGKKMKDRKDKLIGLSSVAFLHQSRSKDESAYSSVRQHWNNSNPFLCGAADLIDSRTRKLLDDNIKILQQIATNLDYNEIHNNNDLFYRCRQNLTAILNRMNGMPPLPVHINGNLMSILPCITHEQRTINSHLKEEPIRCVHALTSTREEKKNCMAESEVSQELGNKDLYSFTY